MTAKLFAKAIQRWFEKFLPEACSIIPHRSGKGLHKLDAILSKVSGRTDVYIFDGRNTDDSDPVEEAKQLQTAWYLLLHRQQEAQNKSDMKLLEDILAINECSHLVDFRICDAKPGSQSDSHRS